LDQKRKELRENINRLENGITKLRMTNDQIAGLKIILTEL
jgi:hypothetical protein